MINTALQLDERISGRELKTLSRIQLDGPAPIVEEPSERTGVTLADLLHAAAQGYAMIVRYVIAAGVDVNGQDTEGRTPLMVAATREVRDILIEAGARQAAFWDEEAGIRI